MAKSTAVYKTININSGGASFANADGTTKKSVIAAGANDSIIKSVVIGSTDTSNRNVVLWLYDGANYWPIASVAVPLGAGTIAAVQAVDAMDLPFLTGNTGATENLKVIELKTGWSLYASMVVAVTAATTVTVVAISEDY